jgi:hypothetical protein
MSFTGGCGNCEFAGQSMYAFAGETKMAFTEDGSIVYTSVNDSACGIGFGKVDAPEIASHYPDLLQRLADCEGPIEETAEVPRTWPLGALGLVKQVTVQRCGATGADELMRIISESSARHGVHKVKLEEAYGS